MAKILLKTKLHIPAARPEWIPRDHLIQKLNDGLASQISLLSAPAGYGKTTLLSLWLNQLTEPAAWLTLDEGDNDPVLFMSYFITMLENISSHLGVGLSSSFQNPQPVEFEPLVGELINRIYAFQDHFVIVLDDFHCITAPPVPKIIQHLVENQPQNMHLVISSRVDPPLELARLRGQGAVVEIRQQDLRTSLAEATEFVKRSIGENLTDEEIAAVTRRTEGWFAGLKLAAMSLSQTPGKKTLIKDISGADTFIADYLAGEVLKQMPPALNEFLLSTSILGHLSGPLCEAVTGQAGGQETLESLLDSNFFITSLDSHHTWYRYHTLISDLLRSRLNRLRPGEVSELHLRASGWFENEGLIEEAIDHALKAGEFQRAANLISRWAESTLLEGRVVTFMRFADQLPEEIRSTHPRISAFYINLLILKGTPPARILTMLEELEQVDIAGDVAGEVMLLRAYLGLDQEDNYRLLKEAIQTLPLDRTYFRGFATSYFGMIQTLQGELDIAAHSFLEVVQTSKRTQNTFLAVLGYCRLGDIALIRGQLHEAEAAYRQAFDFAQEQLGNIHPLLGEALVGLGRIHYERNALDQSKQFLTQGITLVRQIGETRTMVSQTILANIFLLEGNIDLAHQAMLKAELITKNSTNKEVHQPIYISSRIRFELLHGNLANAVQWAAKSDLPDAVDQDYVRADLASQPLTMLRTVMLISKAMVEIAEERYSEGLAILDPLLDLASQKGWLRDLLLIQVLRSVAYRGLDQWDAALACLNAAFALAEPEDYLRPFLDQGRPMFELLHQAARQNPSHGFTQRLLSELRRMTAISEKEDGQIRAQPIIEPLTRREIEVLRLIENGFTNKQVAQDLIISPGTVKKHLDHIYQKLGVHTRSEAIARARELKII